MINKNAAMRGAQAAVGSEPIEDVAIAFPVGTTRAQARGSLAGDSVGAVASVAADLSTTAIAGSVTGGGGLGQLLAQRRLEKTEPAASIVLALTANNLYLLGRHKIGPLASFANLEVIHKISRNEADLNLTPAGVTQHLSIVDEEDNASYEYEVKPLGSGIKKLIADLEHR